MEAQKRLQFKALHQNIKGLFNIQIANYYGDSTLTTHTLLIKGVEVHPLIKGVSKTTCLTAFFSGPTPLIKGLKVHPLI